jgi:tetratricopeptide (TPR) repeat protein
MQAAQNSMPRIRTTAPTRARFAQQFVRGVMIAGGLLLMGWAATNIMGCGGFSQGKYTKEGKSLAENRLNAFKAASEYQMSSQALEGGDLNKALKHCDKAIELNPKIARTWVLRGRVMLERNDLQACADSLERATTLDDTFVDAHYFKGLLAERISNKADALKHYGRAAELDPNNAQYALATAEMMIDTNEIDAAEQYLLARQERFRHTPGVHQALGHIQALRGNSDKAEEYLTQARILAPEEPELLEDLARVQFNNSKYAQADANLTKLLKIETFATRRDLQHMKAKCLMSLDRATDARTILVDLTRSDEGASDVDAWISLGQVAYTLKDTARLRQSFARSIALAPDRAEGYVLKGLHLRRLGDLPAAELEFQKAIERQPDAESLVMLGIAQAKQGKLSQAQESFKLASEQDPSDEIAARLALQPQLAQAIDEN